MTPSDPLDGMTPKPREGTRESDDAKVSDDRTASQASSASLVAADRPLPPFLLQEDWEPDVYDEVVLEWHGEAYLQECGVLHLNEDEGHGIILALVVIDPGWIDELGARGEGEDWVEECRAIAGGSVS